MSNAESGFSGGDPAITSYRAVCEGTSGHAEVVQVTYDPAVVGYAELLQLFFVFHDPTTLNRRGADVGTVPLGDLPRRSAGGRRARAHRRARRRRCADPIVTEVVAFDRFFPAEEHHQGLLPPEPEAAVLPGGDRAQGRQAARALRVAPEAGGVMRGLLAAVAGGARRRRVRRSDAGAAGLTPPNGARMVVSVDRHEARIA